jgi:hypothetical protein
VTAVRPGWVGLTATGRGGPVVSSAARPPLYFRLLRIRHLRVRPWLVFVLFEGSIALGVLLTLAEITSSWAIVAVPVAVAAMVKVNDVVSGAALVPVADAQLRRPGVVQQRAKGRSPVPRPGRHAGQGTDTAIESPAMPGSPALAPPANPVVGVAKVTVVSPRRRLRGSATAVPPLVRSDGADRRSRGNQGRFTG